MIVGLTVAIIGVLLAALMQGMVLRKRERMLRMKEQCFRFHELRDQLQVLTIERKLRADSRVYEGLLALINFAIHNAGMAKLRDVLTLSRMMKEKVESNSFNAMKEDLRSCPAEVQALASDVFITFARMLVANDDITYWVFAALELGTKIVGTGIIHVVKTIAQPLSPTRAKLVHDARQYKRLGRRLCTSH